MARPAVRAAVFAAALGFAVASAVPALAHDEDARGQCSGYATWRLKVTSDDGRLEVEGRVYAGRRGQPWKWQILHDGGVSYRGQATTAGSSESFRIERRVVDSPGTDRIGWRAVNTRSGQNCHGSVSI
jgi:hypothetical protein